MGPAAGSALFGGTRRFEVRECLGAGGMGVVYRALDRERGVEVALKTIRAPQSDSILRFKSEFRALADLAHPNLVSLGELFVENGQWFFTMELIPGVDLLSWVRPGAAGASFADDSAAGGEPTSHARPGRLASRETAPMNAPSDDGEATFTPSRWARAPLDESRLRGVLSQLARGLCALHEAGKIHRDVKPSNVMVAPDGRAILLDFGLVTDVASAAHLTELQVLGTTGYASPEQVTAQPVGPDSDWYSVGVVLFEALTGRLPFEGRALEVLRQKQRAAAPAPASLAPNVPADLNQLCVELLQLQRTRRPGGRELLARLEGAPPPVRGAAPAGTPFVGRAAELAALDGAFAEVARGRGGAMVVRGESGVGKSALVRRFVELLVQRSPDAVVLRGRCYERETVPYKAVDGVIDSLSRYWHRLGAGDASALLPRRAALLTQAFPVLGRVDVLARAPRPRSEALDPHQQRRHLFSALREIWTRLGERHPLVLFIDDLQWADADSLSLLAEVMRPPDVPPLLLLVTVRGSASRDLGQLLPGEVREIELAALPPTDAEKLAELLLSQRGDAPAEAGTALSIAKEAGGHPLFIDELVRHLERTGAARPSRLEEALSARAERLGPAPRRLLELVAVAAAPLDRDLLAAAAGIERADFGRVLAELRVAHLLRSTADEAVEPFHDRVRTAILAQLGLPALTAHHRALAEALEAAGATDAEALALHWQGADRPERAAIYARAAATRAFEALAWSRAAQLYRLALDNAGDGETRALEESLGAALANAGRGAEAAAAFQRAAAQAGELEALDLRRRAAEQLLISGHIDAGLDALREVLSALDMPLPVTSRGALASVIWRRAQLRLRGLHFRPRGELPERERVRIDVCWSVAIGLGMVDNIRGADFQARHMLLALRAGDPLKIARALALEVDYSATSGGATSRRTARLLALGEELSRQVGDTKVAAQITAADGGAAFLEGRWRHAKLRLDAAAEQLRERCTDAVWELDTARHFGASALVFLGELRELSRRMPELERDADERGDRYLGTNLRVGHEHLLALAAGEPRTALESVDHAMALWSQRAFQIEHFYELLARGQIDLYRGDGAACLSRLDERWRAMKRSLLMQVQIIRIEMLHLRARAALMSAGGEARAERDAAQVARERMPWSDPLAGLIRAALAIRRGDGERGALELRHAAGAFDRADMALHAAAARRRLGQLTGGDEGRALIAASEAWMTTEGVRDAEQLTALLAPMSVLT